MKLIAFVLLFSYAYTQQTWVGPEPYWCMAGTSGPVCTECYNSVEFPIAVTNIGPREVTGGNCDTAITTAVANIKQYNPAKVAAVACTDIQYCATGNWANIDCTNGGITTACATTAADTTTCAASIGNCDQDSCFKKDTGAYVSACVMCNTLKMPGAGATDILDNAATVNCDTGTITNCNFYDITQTAKCYSCDSGTHVLQSNQDTCNAYNAATMVQYCRITTSQAGNAECGACLQGYLFRMGLCVPAYQVTPTFQNVLAASKCMGNQYDNVNCSSCYNYALGTILPRQQIGTSCSEPVANVVHDCLWYKGNINRTRALDDCGQCNGKLWMNIFNVGGAITIHCSDTSNDDQATPTCTGTLTGCDQLVCIETTEGTAYTKGCRLCSAGFKGATIIANIGYETCVDDADSITNCSVYGAIDNTICYSCSSGNAVRADSKACLAFSLDTNCRQLSYSGQYCNECKNNYYMVNNTCTLGYDASTATTTATTAATSTTTGANLMTASAFIMALLVFFN